MAPATNPSFLNPLTIHRPSCLPKQLGLTGMIVTLIMPLIILMVAHDLLEVPLEDAHGAVIFLFFSWVTASQAVFSLYRLDAVASWKVASAMIAALFLIGFTYLWAGEALYPFSLSRARSGRWVSSSLRL